MRWRRKKSQINNKKVIILLDEYDTPMQEAYIHGYWEEFTTFIRSLFNSTFKTNPYLERAMMTGITRVSKESAFSDLHLKGKKCWLGRENMHENVLIKAQSQKMKI